MAQKPVEDPAYELGSGWVTAAARARQVNSDIHHNPPLLQQKNPVGQRNSLTDIVRYHDGGEALILPHVLDQRLHLDPGQRIERTQRFVKGKNTWMAHQSTGQGDTLLLTAGEDGGPSRLPASQADLCNSFNGAAAPVFARRGMR